MGRKTSWLVEIDGEKTSKGKRRVDLATGVALVVFVLAAVLPELFTDRYGSLGIGSVLPGAPYLAVVTNIIGTLALSFAGLLLLRHLYQVLNYSHSERSSPRSLQKLVWVPYIATWLFAYVFGAVHGAPNYSFIGLLAVLSLSIVLPSRASPLLLTTARWIVRSVVVVSAIVGAWFPMRAFSPYEVWPGGWWAGVDRLQGIFPHPNTLGWIAAIAAAIELFGSRSRLRFIFVGISVLVLLQSGSRTATLALVAGVATAVLIGWARRSPLRKSLAWLFTPVVFVIGAVVVAGEGVTLDSFNGRLATWQDAMDGFTSSWLSGIGPGAYAVEGAASGGYAHNQILQTLSELGIVGFIGLVVHVGALIRIWRAFPYRALISCGVTMWLMMFLTENLLRFAAPSFMLQIVFFQLLLWMGTQLDGTRPHKRLFARP